MAWIFMGSVPLLLGALYLFRFSPSSQFKVIILATLIYVVVALLHHNQDKTLTWEILIEYILIAALALIIIQGLFI